MSKGDNDLSFLLGCVGLSLVVNGLRMIRLRRKIEDMPLSKLRSAPQGLVEIQGYVWSCKDATVPTTKGRRAVWRSLEIVRGSGRKRHTIFSDTFEPLFFVSDGTSVAALDPSNATINAEKSTKRWERLGAREQAWVKDLMHSKGAIETPSRCKYLFGLPLFGPYYLVKESVILPGSPIYVCGAFTTPAHPLTLQAEKGLPEFEDMIRALRLDKRIPKHWDKDRDGKLSASEAREGLYRLSTRVQPKLPGDVLNITCAGILQSDKTHTLFIADCHQEHLRRAMSPGYSLLQIVGGLICLGLGMFLLH